MYEHIALGLLAGLLLASLILNAYQRSNEKSLDKAWQFRWREAEDRANAAQVRSAEQIDAMLDRISTSPRLEVHEPAPPLPDPTERPYISDFPYEDERWNDFRTPDKDATTS
jgi:hypothetical protein